MKAPILGFLPDVDPVTPGILTACSNLIPTTKGMKGAPGEVSGGIDALAATCLGAALCIKLDSTWRVFAGTTTKLYEVSGTTWADRTRASGGDYSTSTDSRWRFAQFGDTTLAVNGADTLQSSNTGVFADVAGAPSANCIDTVANFVMLAGTNEGTYGDQTDRWWCSAINDATDWTTDVATQCTTGRLVNTPGAITAIKRFGTSVVAYKEKSLYLGTYAGPPVVWKFDLIPGEIGAPSQEAVVNIGSSHIFVGYDDFYVFDGTRPVPIGEGIKEWFFADLNKKYRYKIIGAHDPTNSLVYFYYPSTASTSGAIDSCVVYHYKAKKWGVADRAIEAAIEYLTGQITYANIGDYFADYASMPAITYDSPFWTSSAPVVAIIDTTNTVKTLTGASTTSSMTTGDIGDDDLYMLLSRDRPRFSTAPTSATMTNYYRNSAGEAFTTDQTVTLTDGSFDVLRSARWHRLQMDFTGPVEITAHSATLQEDGL